MEKNLQTGEVILTTTTIQDTTGSRYVKKTLTQDQYILEKTQWFLMTLLVLLVMDQI